MEGYDAKTTTAIAGGEIVFHPNNPKAHWNLKSTTFSLGGKFDEEKSSPQQFKDLLDSLWLPNDDDNYWSIAATKSVALNEFFSSSGSFKEDLRVNKPTVTFSRLYEKSPRRIPAAQTAGPMYEVLIYDNNQTQSGV